MAKEKTLYTCTECGWSSPKWMGQCKSCNAWGTLEENTPSARSISSIPPSRPALPIGQIDSRLAQYRSTGIGELNRVLGGGLVPGAVILLAGEPGVGKSTLLIKVGAAIAHSSQPGHPALYITGEESASQVTARALRVGAIDDALLLAEDSDLSRIIGHIDALSPSLLIIDSIQTITSSQVEGGAGGTTQVRAVASALIRLAKERALPILLVGHVTKDGGIAGPRVLEHLVDVVCYFEGDRETPLRLLRAVKNRYGPTDEVGCFQLTDTGMKELPDPSGLFLSETTRNVSGSCVTLTLEGRRPMPIEIQALVATSSGGSPRRTTSGVEQSRVAMMLAVLQARASVDASTLDVYVSTIGGARIRESAADLATALALASAACDTPIREGFAAIGEVSLTGEIRPCIGMRRRIHEAARLGFTTVVVPPQKEKEKKGIPGITILSVRDLRECLSLALQ